MANGCKLFSERLVLRSWAGSDSAELFRLAKEPEVGLNCGWIPHKNEEESKCVIKVVLSVPETYAVCLKKTGKLIGCISLKIGGDSDLNLPSTEAEIGYWFGKPYWGKGYATEATRLIIAHAFENLKFNTLWCTHFDGNNASGRVAEKCGFSYVKTQDDFFAERINEHKILHIRKLVAKDYFAMQDVKEK